MLEETPVQASETLVISRLSFLRSCIFKNLHFELIESKSYGIKYNRDKHKIYVKMDEIKRFIVGSVAFNVAQYVFNIIWIKQ